MFVCLFGWLLTCFFILIILEHPQEYTLKILWRSDLIWLRNLGTKNVYLFVCLFVCLFMDLFVFCFNHLGTSTGSYSENFLKTRLDLYEIFRILKMFICLCVCLFVYCFFILIIMGNPQEDSLKVLWRSEWIWLRYLGSQMFICFFVYGFVCFLF